MKKTPTLFKINRKVINGIKIKTITNELTPGAEWVSEGKGQAFVKSDGKPIFIKDDKIYYRIIHNKNSNQKVQSNWIECEREYDLKTNLKPFWVPLTKEEFPIIFEQIDFKNMRNGTYELIGEDVSNIFPPKSNSEKRMKENGPLRLTRHYTLEIVNPPRTFDEIRAFFEVNPIHEGIVFYNKEDGTEFKVRLTDFNIQREFNPSPSKCWKIKEWEKDQRGLYDDIVKISEENKQVSMSKEEDISEANIEKLTPNSDNKDDKNLGFSEVEFQDQEINDKNIIFY